MHAINRAVYPPTFLIFLFLLTSCGQSPSSGLEQPRDPYAEPSMEGESLNVIVEIPAGSNHKIEYRPDEGFINDTLPNGGERIINFLPYPGNYGFIPSTLMSRDRGGDGDPLDVIVLSEGVPTGSKLAVKPIAALLLRDRGEIDTKIVAVPVDSSLQVFPVDNFLDFALQHDAARSILELWFLNYKGPNSTELLRWEDEEYAWREVRKWRLDNPK
ncbi:inorganic diphosphatase [Lewinella sp. W8]|uniref:inorganic diphosphatase n=1 Tax=Lewinella sp. W8 TaxID=2528208 RepID=UPI0010673D40|nr:inorganic diphosphatase [Lewinella sp. W8]MTB53247.1 inorganic diphosphatase [Lewinella sp. W8]